MRPFLIKPIARLRGAITFSGDKSIAHRAVIFSALSKGTTCIENFPANDDCLSTVNAFKKLGIKITFQAKKRQAYSSIIVYGKGLYGLQEPRGPLFVGDSGTTLRLLLGILSGQRFSVTLQAGPSLSKRPMLRVTQPLRSMGARIAAASLSRNGDEYAPLVIHGNDLSSITYRMPVASAQVKSALILAGLYCKESTTIIEPVTTRDHTERMVKLFNGDIRIKKGKGIQHGGQTVIVTGKKQLTSPKRIYVPGDISSASFFMVMALIIADAQMVIKNVGLNPARMGIVRVLRRMGARIQIARMRDYGNMRGEPMGDLVVKSSSLKAIRVNKKEIPSLIDELPILMVAAALAKGTTVFEGVQELRVKETDRIASMMHNLKKMGARIEVETKGIAENVIVQGVKELKASKTLQSFGDHRTAMSMVVAALRAEKDSRIDDIACIKKSFPDFLDKLKKSC